MFSYYAQIPSLRKDHGMSQGPEAGQQGSCCPHQLTPSAFRGNDARVPWNDPAGVYSRPEFRTFSAVLLREKLCFLNDTENRN